jgi:hypothetical protein
MTARRITAVLAAAGALGAFAVPAATAGAEVYVCNEAQSSWKGIYDATASDDPLPPARNKDAAMRIGSGKGLLRAAENSPALAVCLAPEGEGEGEGTT